MRYLLPFLKFCCGLIDYTSRVMMRQCDETEFTNVKKVTNFNWVKRSFTVEENQCYVTVVELESQDGHIERSQEATVRTSLN